MAETTLARHFPLFKRGKVREVYDLGDRLLLVASDRISAFDFVLPSEIPGKGQVLNQLSAFWFRRTEPIIPNHLLDAEPEKSPEFAAVAPAIAGRAMVTRKLETYPLEAIVRGYLVGSGWKSYQQSGEVCGIRLPAGLQFADPLPEPLFTPSTKAEQGHDENISFAELANRIGTAAATDIRDRSLRLFAEAGRYARQRGILIADSKFEFGHDPSGQTVLIDEIFTPDSSRFWRESDYRPGQEPPSFDKQFVRNYLLGSSWDRRSTPPPLPADIVAGTQSRYREIFRILTGRPL